MRAYRVAFFGVMVGAICVGKRLRWCIYTKICRNFRFFLLKCIDTAVSF